jgi:hypothetical protein
MDSVIPMQIIQSAAGLVDQYRRELALGISGSFAKGTPDAFSDVDICIFVIGDYPPAEELKTAYDALGFTDPIYFDVDFDSSRGDGFIRDGYRCDFNWMVVECVHTFLDKLGTDFDCPEWLPGGLASVIAIHDSGNLIADLQEKIPDYPRQRSRYRVRRALMDAHHSLYNLEWLPKAAHRDDTFSFLKHQYLLLEKFFYSIFALNRVWFSDEKHLSEKIMRFRFVPWKADQRVQNMILNQDSSKNLAGRLRETKSLFRDAAICAHQVYPDLDLPAA